MCSSPIGGGSLRRLLLIPQLVREQTERLCIDLGRVPLEKSVEVRLAFIPTRARAPAPRAQKIRGRRQRVGGTGNDVASASPLGVDGVLQVRRRHELGLSDLARPGAALGWAQKAALDERQRVDEFGPIDLRSAALIREGREAR